MSRACPRCSGDIPDDAPGGICPACALSGALTDEAGAEMEVFTLADIPAPGQVIRYLGNYELLEVIGRGGMGVVYRARQRGLDRVVALKMLMGGPHASEEYRRRFQREAQTAAKLQHPGIVPIYEIGEHEGQAYFSMEYVPGADLARVVGQKPLSPQEAADHVIELAEAIQYAHENGVLHRDLKPANILVGIDGRLRITDFGLARQMDGDSVLTLSGETLGSPSYLPPEQISSQRGTARPASDVYALGAVLYFMLTGRPPFLAGTLKDTLDQVRSADPLPPRRLNPAVPRGLEEICLRCLRKNPGRRYPSARALVDALRKFAVHAHRKHAVRDWSVQAAEWARHPLSLGLLALLALTVAGGVVAYRSLSTRLERVSGPSQGTIAPTNETAAANTVPAATETRLLPGILLLQLYSNTPVGGVAQLAASQHFPSYPDEVGSLESFEVNQILPDRTGVRISGWFTPPKSASYVFHLIAEDEAVLYVGESEGGLVKQAVAQEPIQYEGVKKRKVRAWQPSPGSPGKAPGNISQPIPLQAGKRYFVEALMNHLSGSAYLGVHYRTADDPPPEDGNAPAPTEHMAVSPLENTLLGEPEPATVVEGGRASFRVGLAAPGWRAQWLRDATPVAGATNLHLLTEPLRRGDNDAQYQCRLENPAAGRFLLSREVRVTVLADNEPPQLVSAATRYGSSEVFLTFSESLDGPVNLPPAQFRVSGRKVEQAVLGPERRIVALTLDGPVEEDFVAAASGLTDFGGNLLKAPLQVTGKVARFFSRDIGRASTRLGGLMIPTGEDAFDVLAGGIGFGNRAQDDFHFTYREVEGDFEACALVTRLDCSALLASAGLMVRESLDPLCTQVHLALNPAEGANQVFGRALLSKDGTRTSLIPNGLIAKARATSAQWLKITRSGAAFSLRMSSDGSNWDLVYELSVPLPPKVLVGAATASHLFGERAQRGYASYQHLKIVSRGELSDPGSRPATIQDR